MHMQSSILTYTHMHSHVCKHMCAHTCAFTHTYAQVCVHTPARSHAHTHYMRTHYVRTRPQVDDRREMVVVSQAEATRLIESDGFLVHTTVLGHTYGITRAALARAQATGQVRGCYGTVLSACGACGPQPPKSMPVFGHACRPLAHMRRCLLYLQQQDKHGAPMRAHAGALTHTHTYRHKYAYTQVHAHAQTQRATTGGQHRLQTYMAVPNEI